MILVTRLDRQTMLLNPDHIISIEETPDTVITLYNGHHILVRERGKILLNRIIAYRTKVLRRAGSLCSRPEYIKRNRLLSCNVRRASWGSIEKNDATPSPFNFQGN
ncbi:MAG: flagellar FlbD family protein [Trichlorobacter sp.]|nr:flagellar FlbD family protein [Trichlorobacter sp.]